VVLPFIVMHRLGPAMRASNGIAIVMLFLTGYAYATITGRNRWLVGIGMVVVGLMLVGMTMALGG
jgi:VIT1/CCC1 family predicted Fe2+/Mn2+ transporter